MDDWTKEKFWERPPFDPAAVGDAHPEGIYLQVGRALTAWEQLEDDLGQFFSVLTHNGTTETHVLTKHLFGITESSSQRLAMIRAALALYFGHYWENPRIYTPFKNVLKVVGWASHRRNEVAHGRIAGALVHRGGDSPTFSGHFLTAPSYAINRSKAFYGGDWPADDVLVVDRSLYRYRADDIAVFEEKFVLLGAKTRELWMLAGRREHRLPAIVLDLAEKGTLLQPIGAKTSK